MNVNSVPSGTSFCALNMSGVNDDPIGVLEDTSEGILHAVYDIIKG